MSSFPSSSSSGRSSGSSGSSGNNRGNNRGSSKPPLPQLCGKRSQPEDDLREGRRHGQRRFGESLEQDLELVYFGGVVTDLGIIDLVQQILEKHTTPDGQISFREPDYRWLVECLNRAQQYEVLVKQLEHLFLSHKLSFPFKKFYIGNLQEMFQRLVVYKWRTSTEPFFIPNIRQFLSQREPFRPWYGHPGAHLTLPSPPEDYHLIDSIVDGTCQELQRLKAHLRHKKTSPWEYWYEDGGAQTVIRRVLSRREDLCSERLRETLYTLHPECTQFKPTLALSIYSMFNATRALDISAGWGDRLVAALACPSVQQYLAFDPNLDLKPGHDEILDRFCPAGKERASFQVRYQPFESALIEETGFDICFSSPPFFDFESYSALPGQSILTYPQLDRWMVFFLFAAMKNAWDHLRVDGHLVLHITDVGRTRVCEAMCLYAEWMLPNSLYLGVISSLAGARKNRPMWVWRRLAAKSEIHFQSPEQQLQTHYPSLYQLLHPSPV